MLPVGYFPCTQDPPHGNNVAGLIEELVEQAELCEQVGCQLPKRRNPQAIRVLSRDVRIHPDYEGALQITAKLESAAAYAQEYPYLKFTLLNVNGQVIASRIFKPAEYLQRPLRPGERLRARRPVQIALELMAPEQAAVSFEFQFL